MPPSSADLQDGGRRYGVGYFHEFNSRSMARKQQLSRLSVENVIGPPEE